MSTTENEKICSRETENGNGEGEKKTASGGASHLPPKRARLGS